MSELLSRIKRYANIRPEQKVFCEEEYSILSDNCDCNYITWRELDRWSDILAVRLDKECKYKKPVVVYGHKNPYMLVCFLACVKSGRAYCPIDISVPNVRVHSIIQEVTPEIIFCIESFVEYNFRTIHRNEIQEWIKESTGIKEIEKLKPVTGEDVFYIIFTSGSTGNPKGVQITSDCLDNFLKWIVTVDESLVDDGSCIILNQAPFSFDLSVMDLYTALYLGGTIWALNKKTQENMKFLLSSLNHSKAKIWVSTSSFADMCLADKSFNQALMSNLSTFLFCGETLTNKTAAKLLNRFSKANVINTYGPTESTVAVTYVKVDNTVLNQYNPLPIGRSKSGTWITIEDTNGKELGNNIKGEIVITGNTVSLGYFNNLKANERVFEKRVIDGKEYRSYHTGDKGYRQDDLFFYSGRLDFQVKLHGYRIELEDIEANIMKLPNISKVAVTPNYKNDQVNSLTAFVVLKNSNDNIRQFEHVQELRSQLKEFLPSYMIPKKIIFMDSLPLTNNGKVNRKALQEIRQ